MSRPHLRVRRVPEYARYDRASVERVLDRGRVAHVAFDDGGQPHCIPTLYARSGDRVLIHGASSSRMVRQLSAGAPACLTVTVLDGLVLARSVFEHAANYDSVMLFGSFEPVESDAARLDAFKAFTEQMIPGRWDEARAPNRKELKATAILSIAIDQAVVKTRSGPPDDDDSPDAELDVWAGEIPLARGYGTPIASPGLRTGTALSPSVARLLG